VASYFDVVLMADIGRPATVVASPERSNESPTNTVKSIRKLPRRLHLPVNLRDEHAKVKNCITSTHTCSV
jgi:hypothetical protein